MRLRRLRACQPRRSRRRAPARRRRRRRRRRPSVALRACPFRASPFCRGQRASPRQSPSPPLCTRLLGERAGRPSTPSSSAACRRRLRAEPARAMPAPSIDVLADQLVGVLGQLDLRHVAAVGRVSSGALGQRLGDVAGEAGRDQRGRCRPRRTATSARARRGGSTGRRRRRARRGRCCAPPRRRRSARCASGRCGRTPGR